MDHIMPLSDGLGLRRETLQDDARLVLRSDFRMRREPTCISMWRLGDDASCRDAINLHPSTAIMLALMDGERTVAQVAQDFAFVADVELEDARYHLEDVVAAYSDRFAPAADLPAERIRKYNPMAFGIPAEQIDLSARRPGAPFSLVYSVTNACVADCIYCYAERQQHSGAGPMLPLARVMEIIDEMGDLEIPGVVVSGGDPFMHPNIVEILGKMISREIRPAVSTKIEVPEADIKRLRNFGLKRLQISIDTTNPETHAFLTKAPNLLEGTLATGRRAVAAGIRLLINAVLNSYTVAEMEQLVVDMVELGSRSITFTEYTRSPFRHSDELFLSEDQIKQAVETVEALKQRYPEVEIDFRREAELPFEGRALCSGGIQNMAIYPDGKVTLCDQAPSTPDCVVGDLSHQSIKEIWNSERIDAFLYPERKLFAGTACEECPDLEQCHATLGRCFIKSLKAYGTIFGPVPGCPRAPQPTVRLRSGDVVATVN